MHWLKKKDNLDSCIKGPTVCKGLFSHSFSYSLVETGSLSVLGYYPVILLSTVKPLNAACHSALASYPVTITKLGLDFSLCNKQTSSGLVYKAFLRIFHFLHGNLELIRLSRPLLQAPELNRELKNPAHTHLRCTTTDGLRQLCAHPMPAPSSSTVFPVREGRMERISGSSCWVSSLARESSIISSTVAALECSFQNSVMLLRAVKHTGVHIKKQAFGFNFFCIKLPYCSVKPNGDNTT